MLLTCDRLADLAVGSHRDAGPVGGVVGGGLSELAPAVLHVLGQDKHERITTAARELFAEHGVSGITTQQITHRADVANGTLMYGSGSGGAAWPHRGSGGPAGGRR
ncbi:TetR/AcrR family transcriptional regulator [Streptomyces maremycinicus]|uniref:TetR/AcrR family transcriptional regulator n=1 Tax=Streptomyces maremycinicus TaxID=1679753 RepID=UPI0022773D60|nr:TetR/AcrR family transcriptional regulator [Streptomyces sp. NBRC 110468]